MVVIHSLNGSRRYNTPAALKVRTAIARLENGNFSNVEPVGEGVSECKIHFGPGYRVYFGKDGLSLVILLGGGTKQRQSRDIANAQRHWRDYRCGKNDDRKQRKEEGDGSDKRFYFDH